MNDLIKYINGTGSISVRVGDNVCFVDVDVINVRMVYNKEQLQVRPTRGSGCIWKDKESVLNLKKEKIQTLNTL